MMRQDREKSASSGLQKMLSNNDWPADASDDAAHKLVSIHFHCCLLRSLLQALCAGCISEPQPPLAPARCARLPRA